MGIFPGFGGWISQQPKKSEDVKSKPVRETKIHEERDIEMKEQIKLWREANKKRGQYQEPPPTIKVKTDYKLDGLTDMQMEFTMGMPPQAAYDILANQDNISFSREIKGRALLKAVSRTVTSEKDKGELDVVVEKELAWKFLFLSGTIPIRLTVQEDPNKLSVSYQKDKTAMNFLDTFEGRYTVEPVYFDAEHLCKRRKPKSLEEYRKCSGGKGLIASKVKVQQSYRTSFPLDLPLLSSYFRRFTIETTKKVAEDLQMRAGDIRGVGTEWQDEIKSDVVL
ncbi:unnamed protein product [Eruca vesicaria subsp. sativa]|uniref:DUF220 domain-containing protein n=1 Tax=Eruca vesicaria subsp. sativa TaxID=29727 RepID=A0ABC8LTI5_ERUVS|nr:unnamed protein product [Eruca vesicaria subsp. sativa]